MVILKASYTKKTAGAKAALRYIQHRPGRDGANITRTLWGIDGKMERSEAYRMIDEAETGSIFYRMILNFDADKEDTGHDISLRDITEHTMVGVEHRFQKQIQWVAALHADHTPLRHVHIVAILPHRLQVSDLQALRSRATEAAGAQRRARDAARTRTEAQWAQGY